MANIKQLYEDNNKTVEAYPRVWLPVGSLYWNENDISADISKYFVGTWVRVKDVFILAAGDKYASKSSGGEATHTLTSNEMPAHSHSGNTYDAGNHNHYGLIIDTTPYGWGKTSNGSGYIYIREEGYGTSGTPTSSQLRTADGGNHSHGLATNNTGGSGAHNNMPPYYAAYCWKRTA